MDLKYIFMGSPPLAATILETLCEKGYLPAAVVTQPAKAGGRGNKLVPTAVEEYARTQELNILTCLDVNQPATVSALKIFHPDLILVAAFGQIFKSEILALPKLYSLNVHASLLPKYRGAAPIQWALWNGEPRTGVTIQKMAKKLDAGDILLQKSLEIQPEDTSEDLLKKLAVLGGEALVESLVQIQRGTAQFTPQDHTQATYAPKIERSHALLDWKKDALSLSHQIRALQPWPVAETYLNGERLKVFRSHVQSSEGNLAPGTIVTDSKTFLYVVCGDGRALSLTEIQLENRKRLGIKEFLLGYRGSFPHLTMGMP